MNVRDKFKKSFNKEAEWFKFYDNVNEEVRANSPE